MSVIYTLNVLKNKNILFSNEGLPIQVFNNKIITALDLDLFTQMHNGNLIHIFDNESSTTLDKNDFTDTSIYKNLFKDENTNNNFLFNKILTAYENFQNYILNKDTIIDYKYLWDLFTQPNPNLFPKGVNLIILEVKNDMNDYVEFLCPPKYYSNNKIDSNKDYCFILKQNHYYEPILFFKNYINELNDEKTYLKQINEKLIAKHDLQNIKNVLKFINDLYKENYCNATIDNNNNNSFQTVNGSTLQDLLPNMDIQISKQVVNLNGKIIGFICLVKNRQLLEKIDYNIREFNIFIPCFPTYIRNNIEILLLNENNMNPFIQNYEKTKIVLDYIHNNTNGTINLNPKNKVVNEKYIIGLVCNANLFIPTIKKLSDSIVDELEEVYNNYLVYNGDTFVYLDEIILTKNKEDNDRKQIVKKIKLENDLYNLFRNMARMVLNNYKNLSFKNEILNIINTKYYTYVYKFNKVLEILKDKLNKYIIFTNKMNNLEKRQNIYQCVDLNDDCNIFLPTKNLITKKPNETIYFEKLTDELIRFSHYRKFMFDSQYYLNSTLNDYELDSNEILLPQSLTNISYIDEYNNKEYDTSNINSFIPIVNYDVNNNVVNLNNSNTNNDKNKSKSSKKTQKKQCPKRCPRKTRCNKEKGICEPIN